jgi:hypothetical protein
VTENELSNRIIGSAIDVHQSLGPGLLESAYKVVIEIKSVESLNEVHLSKTLTYIISGCYKPGLLINFNGSLLKDGIIRVVNGL